MSETPRFNIRLPQRLKHWLSVRAGLNQTSITKEIISILNNEMNDNPVILHNASDRKE